MTAELVREAADAHQRAVRRPRLFKQMMTSADFPEFLTLIAYDFID